MRTRKQLKTGTLHGLTKMQEHERCIDLFKDCLTHADVCYDIESIVSQTIMLHSTTSMYYDRVGNGYTEPNYSLIRGDIKVGDRVRLISLSPKIAGGFPAEGTVIKVNLQGIEKKIAYKTFIEVDFDVSCNPSSPVPPPRVLYIAVDWPNDTASKAWFSASNFDAAVSQRSCYLFFSCNLKVS